MNVGGGVGDGRGGWRGPHASLGAFEAREMRGIRKWERVDRRRVAVKARTREAARTWLESIKNAIADHTWMIVRDLHGTDSLHARSLVRQPCRGNKSEYYTISSDFKRLS